MTDEQRIARGQRFEAAKAVLEEVFEGVRGHLLDRIENAPPSRGEDILEMHRGLQNLAKVRQAIQLVISDGQHAEGASNIARLHRA